MAASSLEFPNSTACKLGLWASVVLVVTTTAFGIALLFPTANNAAYLSSILIAPSFVAMMVALHHTTPPPRQVWSHLGLAFAIIYALLCMFCYYLQLTVVRVNDLDLPPDVLKAFVFTPGSVVFAQDMLGYAFLCLATLAAAPAFSGGRLAAWLKGLFIAHGLVFVVPLVFPALSFAGSATGDEAGVIANLAWCVFFVPIAVLLAVYFKRLPAAEAR